MPWRRSPIAKQAEYLRQLGRVARLIRMYILISIRDPRQTDRVTKGLRIDQLDIYHQIIFCRRDLFPE